MIQYKILKILRNNNIREKYQCLMCLFYFLDKIKRGMK